MEENKKTENKKKGFDYSVVRDHKTYDILRPLELLVRDMNFKVNYVGRENIPKDGPYIIAANHFNFFDPLMVGLGIKGRQIHYMAKKEIFEGRISAWIYTKLNAFPVNRGAADIQAIKFACNILRSGRILGIFPEGTRSLDGDIGAVKMGVISIAIKTKSDVLPVSLYNGDNLRKHSKVTVRYGKVIRYEDFNFSEKPTKDEINKAAEYVINTIAQLQSMGHD